MKLVTLCVVMILCLRDGHAQVSSNQETVLSPTRSEVITFFKQFSNKNNLQRNLPNFKTCQLDIVNWGLFLLSGKPFKENIRFNSKCHLVTSFTPKLGKVFSIKAKIFKFLKYKDLRISLTMKRNLFPSQSLELHIHRMVFSGAKQRTLVAKMNYKAILDVTSKDLFSSHGRSDLTLIKIGEEKVGITVPINPLSLLR